MIYYVTTGSVFYFDRQQRRFDEARLPITFGLLIVSYTRTTGLLSCLAREQGVVRGGME